MYKRCIDDILETINQSAEDEKITYLFKVIREEVSKPWDEIDQDFVAICSQCVEKYSQGLVSGVTDEMIEQRLLAIKQCYKTIARKKSTRRSIGIVRINRSIGAMVALLISIFLYRLLA